MYWKISDFTEEIKRKVGERKLNRKTVDIWFKKMEEDRIHYVNRTEDTHEKVYDELDLQIGVFIKKKRNDNWSLNAIFNEIRDHVEVRPFPIESYQNMNETLPTVPNANHMQSKLLDRFREELIEEMQSAFEEVAAGQFMELKSEMKTMIKHLIEPINREDEREKRFQDLILRRRVEYQLEKEALLIWTAKPVDERYKKVGLFRREEDITKRDLFVKEFIHRHFAERMRKEIIFDANQEKMSV